MVVTPYRGRVLIINNLAGSALWHRLASLEPPPGLLHKLQSLMIKVFWLFFFFLIDIGYPRLCFFCPKKKVDRTS